MCSNTVCATLGIIYDNTEVLRHHITTTTTTQTLLFYMPPTYLLSMEAESQVDERRANGHFNGHKIE